MKTYQATANSSEFQAPMLATPWGPQEDSSKSYIKGNQEEERKKGTSKFLWPQF